ncbi:hypothetical protein OFS07_15530 [Brachyspira hyodysenteriae]|nr:hypothetical protein [Brachyspira hyodysenteriae]MDA0063039.1 hypothetical protein [Brachyspira hyodysenteriae]MDA0066675.1 hypothetical protein [Brachyspira hyodysenteriae]MDA0067670.1 hypothetical protein [Brachyspira hyodysenteriae]MDA0073010.1 hypothetical protein [Brachyspira hyodysenteriae]
MSFFKDGKNPILSYDECKNIYRTATLGKRIVEGASKLRYECRT